MERKGGREGGRKEGGKEGRKDSRKGKKRMDGLAHGWVGTFFFRQWTTFAGDGLLPLLRLALEVSDLSIAT